MAPLSTRRFPGNGHPGRGRKVKLEVEHEGFRQVRVFDDLPRQHLIVFASK